MLPAIGAASIVFDTIQSLTSPQPASSQPAGGFSALSDLDDSSDAPSAGSATIPGFSSAQISSDNFNALLNAQNLASVDFSQAGDGGGPGADSQGGGSISGTASSAYNTVNQLAQSMAIPLGLSISA
jgi:hypothetical protein